MDDGTEKETDWDCRVSFGGGGTGFRTGMQGAAAAASAASLVLKGRQCASGIGPMLFTHVN